jgi:hypothetical protein
VKFCDRPSLFRRSGRESTWVDPRLSDNDRTRLQERLQQCRVAVSHHSRPRLIRCERIEEETPCGVIGQDGSCLGRPGFYGCWRRSSGIEPRGRSHRRTTARATATYRAPFPTIVHAANIQNGIRAAPARTTRTSPSSGTHDSNIAGGPYRASRAPARRTFCEVGDATAIAARPSQYVVQAPSVFPIVATSTGTAHVPESRTMTASGTSEERGRTVAAAKLHANRTSRLRVPSAPCRHDDQRRNRRTAVILRSTRAVRCSS